MFAPEIQAILAPYNPWWRDQPSPLGILPDFHRPVFYGLLEDLNQLPQMLSITGPRRIGKSTLLQQLIRRLLGDGVSAGRIVYYAFDDPALMSSRVKVDELVDDLMRVVLQKGKKEIMYLFLDEIQRLERWELYLKKYYDLKYPMRVVISGSASSPIFKKSRESLLGRVKDYRLLPFSFREFVLYELRHHPAMISELHELYETGKITQGIITGDPSVEASKVSLRCPSDELRIELDAKLKRYFLEGGFPEVWTLPSWVAKQDYLYDNQVKKVIYEDLVLAAEFRKPELLKRFYISLLEAPGREVNVQSAAKETEINAQQIEKYLPLLEMTDLVYKIFKFRSSPVRLRKGMMKFYLVDLALRNAVLRLADTLLEDDQILGLYAENLVFLALKKWRGTIQMDYYRDRDKEVDFIVHTAPRRFLPVEVKYRNRVEEGELKGLVSFRAKHPKASVPLVVTKKWEDFGRRDQMFYIPLPMFLILFD